MASSPLRSRAISDAAEVSLIPNAYASDQAAPCSENRGAAGVGRTPAALAAWLRTIPGLSVSTPVPATIGGLSGVVVDLAVAPGATPQCGPGLYTFALSGSDDGGWSSRLHRERHRAGEIRSARSRRRLRAGHRDPRPVERLGLPSWLTLTSSSTVWSSPDEPAARGHGDRDRPPRRLRPCCRPVEAQLGCAVANLARTDGAALRRARHPPWRRRFPLHLPSRTRSTPPRPTPSARRAGATTSATADSRTSDFGKPSPSRRPSDAASRPRRASCTSRSMPRLRAVHGR